MAFDLEARRGDLKRRGQGDSFTREGPGRGRECCVRAGIEVRLWKATIYMNESGRWPRKIPVGKEKIGRRGEEMEIRSGRFALDASDLNWRQGEG